MPSFFLFTHIRGRIRGLGCQYPPLHQEVRNIVSGLFQTCLWPSSPSLGCRFGLYPQQEKGASWVVWVGFSGQGAGPTPSMADVFNMSYQKEAEVRSPHKTIKASNPLSWCPIINNNEMTTHLQSFLMEI